LNTYSVSFADSQYDESEFQRLMAEQLNSRHCAVRVDYEMINAGFMKAIYHLERPVFRTAPVPLSLLSRQVNRNGVKVVLTGEAADEILFGYDSFKELKMLNFWSKCPNSKFRPLLIKKLYPHLKHYADDKMYGLMKMYYEGFLQRPRRGVSGLDIRLHNNKAIANYIHKDHNIRFDEEHLLQKVEQMLPAGYQDWSIYRQQQFMEMNTLLSGYLLSSQGDRMSMANSVEGRYPFLDHRLVEFAFSLPDTFKLKGFSQKHILRDTFKDVIPQAIINRPKLPYQAPDLKSFFKEGRLFGVAEQFLSPAAVDTYGIFDSKMVQRLLKKYETGTPEQIGYRDNMAVVFMLSAHVALHCAANTRQRALPMQDCDVNLSDFKTAALC
jgi:asparagine synthase (glutamine-hydrolysing)